MVNRIWRLLLLGLVTLAMVAVGASPAGAHHGRDRDRDDGPRAPTPTAVRSMWLWNQSDPASVVGWATSHGVSEIFVYVRADLPTSGDLPRLIDLKARADAANITLSALNGEPEWTFNHAAALAWQNTAMGTGLFARTHIDVEPYLLNEWTIDQAGTAQAYLDLLSALRANDTRPLEADVPFWYSTIPLGAGNVADEVLSRVDAVTVMSYRDTATGPNSMMDVGTDMLARASAAGKPVRLAAETQPTPDCLHCTFYEEGQRYMTRTLARVDPLARAYSGFAGIAIHHYVSWTQLRP
jgi:hypothetical protein